MDIPGRGESHARASLYHPVVILLERVLRFSVTTPNALAEAISSSTNGFAGRPLQEGFGSFHELKIGCRGEPDPTLQYVLDIKDIDGAARKTILPAICEAYATLPHPAPAGVVAGVMRSLNFELSGKLEFVRLNLTPTYSVEVRMSELNFVALRQRFDFAAAHRLHSPSLSAEENRRRYGKCNNPRGHGHNYQLEPCVNVAIGDRGEAGLTLAQLEDAVQRSVIDRFDHTHLNEDTAEFNVERGGVIPTVENIAKVLYELLSREIAAGATGATLKSMTVWETDRTSATYPA
jgi:6-pyruvoyltetrahydropterin/6-carboxytetrahydropterin synthase